MAMGSITDFLKYIPEAASSPLAFVAYALVVLAWVVTTWLRGNPERKTRQILAQFKDDALRLGALRTLTNNAPPEGLTGNDAILEWVREGTRSKKRILLVVALGMTLVAVIIFTVAVRGAAGASVNHVTIILHRMGTTRDCPTLPESAHVLVYPKGKPPIDAAVYEDCKASFVVNAKAAQTAILKLKGAGGFSLSDPDRQYLLSLNTWDAYLSSSDPKQRLRLTLFRYTGDCDSDNHAFSTFQGILQTKVNSIRGMFASNDARYDYLSELNIVPAGEVLNLSSQEIRSYWDTTSSLQVLSGLCFRSNGVNIFHSQVFSGELSGDLHDPFIAELPLTPQEFGTTRDIHTVSVLYALAQEALSRGVPHDIVISYLSHAREIAQQVSGANGPQLVAAIDTSLERLGAPAPMVLGK
jgi:hypothetical protein